jgi:hypothetical protein
MADNHVSLWYQHMLFGQKAFRSEDYLQAESCFILAAKIAISMRPLAVSKSLHWWGLCSRALGRARQAERLFMLARRQRADPHQPAAVVDEVVIEELRMCYEPAPVSTLAEFNDNCFGESVRGGESRMPRD